jgi:acyl-CoA reductase-like NAD-dependent aldehyde dehydrogenase
MANEGSFAMMEKSDRIVGRQRNAAGGAYFADYIDKTQGTSKDEIDNILRRLQQRKDEWVKLPIIERLDILDEIHGDLLRVRHHWIKAELTAKAHASGSTGEAEEWGILATVFRAVRILRRSLNEIKDTERPKIPGSLETRSDGKVIARVFPCTLEDRVLLPGVTGEVWMEPGVAAADVTATQAWAYRDRALEGKIALVLGAGNAAVLPVVDLLHKLFVELQVVVLKLNPVNAHMGPIFEEGFRALINRHFLQIVYGGKDEGAYLSNHNAVDELHLTGSDKTYEAVVFGTGRDGHRRRVQREPGLQKRFTGELGNVSPVIVVPGPWPKRDIRRQAGYIATWMTANAGFACLSPRVIIQHRNWPLRNSLIEEIGNELRRVPTRKAYYPGAFERHSEFIARHPESLNFGDPEGDHLPWTLIPGIEPTETNDICFKREAFCSLCAETAIDAPGIPDFLERAVDFANSILWGTLSATLIVHPESLRDPDVSAAVDRAIDRLRYGTVTTNILAYFSTYLMGTPWGAFPGSDIYDIQSGIGKTFNFLMFARPEKSVVRAPFRRVEPTDVTSSHAAKFCRMAAEFEAKPSLKNLAGLGLISLQHFMSPVWRRFF